MKKRLFCILAILFLSIANVARADYFDLPSINNLDLKTPKFENIDFNLEKSEQKLKKLHARGVKKVKKLSNTNLLVNKKKYRHPINANTRMLMTSPENVNIDVQKISFGNEISVHRINSIDPKNANENPGGRGINELIVYTPEYGLKTGTNEYGKEVIVVDNRVVALSAMDSIIPLNGFVISGHGKAKEWIEKNIILGARIDINKTTMAISSMITPETYVYEAQEKIREAKEINCYYKNRKYSMLQSDFYIEKANSSLNYARYASKSFDLVLSKKYAHNSIIYANRAIACSVPYCENELKGVWLRPKDRNPEKIAQILNHLKSIGIDNIFLETYYHGTTIFPCETIKSYGLVGQRPEFMGTDVLKIWLDEAHKRNMKVHVWFQTFYIGNDFVSPMPRIMRSKYPDWLNRQYWSANSIEVQPSKAEHLGYFLDPANPAVQEYLTKILREIATKYDVDGINIDYIRYPVCSPSSASDFLSTSWGYTAYAIDEYKKCYGNSPMEIRPNTGAWCSWENYRMEKVTSFVEKLQDLKRIRPSMTISTVIFPDEEQSAILKLQDWPTWGKKCYVDAFTPLFLSSNVESTKKYLTNMMEIKNPKVKVYAGLFEPFTYTEPTTLTQEIKTIREISAEGIIIFDYAHFTKPYQQVLAIRAFNRNNK